MRLMLPSTSAACYLLLDPSRRNLLFNQSAYPNLQVQSVTNRATESAIIQSTSSAQPTWSANALQGTYSWRNNPGAFGSSTPAGMQGLTFNGTSQYLEYDSLAAKLAGPSASFTVVSAVQCNASASASTIWSAGDASDGYNISLYYQSGNINFSESNLSGTYTVSAALDTKVHVVTCVRTASTLYLRVDNAATGNHVVTDNTEAYTTFCVGALKTNGAVGSYFNGSAGCVAVYAGNADIDQVEVYLLEKFGVIRGATSGTNVGF